MRVAVRPARSICRPAWECSAVGEATPGRDPKPFRMSHQPLTATLISWTRFAVRRVAHLKQHTRKWRLVRLGYECGVESAHARPQLISRMSRGSTVSACGRLRAWSARPSAHSARDRHVRPVYPAHRADSESSRDRRRPSTRKRASGGNRDRVPMSSRRVMTPDCRSFLYPRHFSQTRDIELLEQTEAKGLRLFVDSHILVDELL